MHRGPIAAVLLSFALPAAAALPTFTIDPQRGPASGHLRVHLHSQGFVFQQPKVIFDTTPALSGVEIAGLNDAYAVSPPHAVGPVDVFVVQNGIAYHSPNTFTYVGPEEEILVPIAVDAAPGAYGARWTSEIWVHNDADQAVRVTPEFCYGIGNVFPCSRTPVAVPPHVTTALPMRSTYEPEPWVLLYPPADLADQLHFTVRLRDANSEPAGGGTEIPVVRTRDFRKRIVLPGIANSDRFRGVLRVYTRDAAIAVRVFDAATGEQLDARPIERFHPTDIDSFGTVTIHDLLTTPLVRAHERVTVTVEAPSQGAWALMTLTDNTTQHVAAFTPQP